MAASKVGAAKCSRDPIHMLLRPRSIGVVGATDKPNAFGRNLFEAVRGGRHGGRVYPVNPNYKELLGEACLPNIASLPEVPDCVAFAVSDKLIEGALTEAAEAGVKAAVIFGRAYERQSEGTLSKVERLSAIAREAGMAVCGGNGMGFMNFVDGVQISHAPPPVELIPGPVGMISHSGSSWSGLIGNQRQLRFNYAISSGQEIATTMADFVHFLIDQPETRVIALMVEVFRDPKNMIAAFEAAAKHDIAIIALKLGRSDRAREFALAHSGAMTGSDAAYRAVFEQHNVVTVRTLDEFTDTIELFSSPRSPKGDALGILTNSGGERELIVDIADDIDCPLAIVTEETAARLREVLDEGMPAENPLDYLGDGRAPIAECMSILADDPGIGIVSFSNNMVHRPRTLQIQIGAFEVAYKATDKPCLLFGNLHSSISRPEQERLRNIGVPVLMGTETALLAMKHRLRWEAGRLQAERTKDGGDDVRQAAALALIQSSLVETTLPLEAAWSLLALFEVPIAESAFASTEKEVARKGETLGFPLALKTANPKILHKTESGGVRLGVRTEGELIEAYSDIFARCGPSVQIQKQIISGPELLLGMVNDSTFGPIVTMGLGGIFTEILADVVSFVPPISEEEALQYLRRLRAYKILEGARGKPPANMKSLCQLISSFSALCASVGSHFSELELNPVIAGPENAVAVDALFVPKNRDK